MVIPGTIDHLHLRAGLGPYDARMTTADGAFGIGKQLPHGTHWPHVLAALPYVGIVAVISMHLFGHGGRGGRGGHGGTRGGLGGTPGKGSDPT